MRAFVTVSVPAKLERVQACFWRNPRLKCKPGAGGPGRPASAWPGPMRKGCKIPQGIYLIRIKELCPVKGAVGQGNGLGASRCPRVCPRRLPACIFCNRCDNLPQTRWLETTHMDSLAVLRTEAAWAKVSRFAGLVPSGSGGDRWLPYLLQRQRWLHPMAQGSAPGF